MMPVVNVNIYIELYLKLLVLDISHSCTAEINLANR